MNHNILYVFVLLFSTVYSTNLAGCRKIGEINNNINNQPLYSTGLYMCLELSDQNLLGDKINNNLVFSETNNLKPMTNLSTSKILNSKNLTNTTNKFNASYISEEVEKNTTNNDPSLVISSPVISSPSPDISSPVVSSPDISSPSPIISSPVISPSPVISSPSPVISSPSPVISSPSPILSSSIKPTPKIPEEVNISPSIVNLTSKNNTRDSIDLEINPLLPTVITLSSILVLVSCILLIRYIYNKKREHKVFTSKNTESQQKTDNNIESDIETGEKKRGGTQLFSHKNNMKSKLHSIKRFKTTGKIVRNNKEKNNRPPDSNQVKLSEKNQKKRVREILLERSKNIPGGENNKNIKKLLTRLSVNGTKNSIEKIEHIDIINNVPIYPPPPLPPPLPQEDITIKSQDSHIIYQNPNNNLSPKMLVNDINR
mgnify:CR=1 FL=1|jgi:hypothetical protein